MSVFYGRRIQPLTVLAPVLLASACTWVELEPEAQQVAIISAGEAAQCKSLGKTTAKSLDKVAFVSRSREKLAAELATLARNDAVSMGGNALVAESEIEGGARRYGVYLCPRP